MTMSPSDSRILIRATRLDASAFDFADALAEASGSPVTFLLDERKGPVPHEGRSVTSLTDARCRSVGLYLPADYPWRCGDYGYYLAREEFPDARFLWMVEFDVRFAGDQLAEFFRFFAAEPAIDFIATDFRRADADWHWTRTCFGRDVEPYRCLFPMTRLSASAIDALLEKRRAHARRRARRVLWPNDEAMVATTLANAGFTCRDINDFGTRFYDAASFTFTTPIDGDSLVIVPGPTRMMHPVLYGRDYLDKIDKLRAPEAPERRSERFKRRMFERVNRLSRW